MFAPTRYIAWALEFYGKIPYDLASSGIPYVPWTEIGAPPAIDDPAAFDALRRAIASYNEVPLGEVTPALGAAHGIFLAYAAVLSVGDEILVEHPGYEPLSRAAEGLGVTVRTFERREDEGFRLDPARILSALGPRTRAVVVTDLHNPTGVRADRAALVTLADAMQARGGYLVVDEVYAPFAALPEDGVFRGSARKLGSNVIAIGSLTKCYGLGMHRIGWVLGPEEISARAEAASIATFGHLPLSHASYGAAAFAALGPVAARARNLIGDKRVLAEQWVSSLPNARWSAPECGLFGMVTLPGRGDLRERIEARAREAGVLVGAGTFFGAPESFRLSWASCSTEKFEEGLRLLEPLAR